LKNLHCVKSERIEICNGYEITRDEDRELDEFTNEFKGRIYVFYSVCNVGGDMLDCFKTIEKARKYAISLQKQIEY
jgi:hypothetical protein